MQSTRSVAAIAELWLLAVTAHMVTLFYVVHAFLTILLGMLLVVRLGSAGDEEDGVLD